MSGFLFLGLLLTLLTLIAWIMGLVAGLSPKAVDRSAPDWFVVAGLPL